MCVGKASPADSQSKINSCMRKLIKAMARDLLFIYMVYLNQHRIMTEEQLSIYYIEGCASYNKSLNCTSPSPASVT